MRPGGCSGYSYEMFFDSELAEDDIVRSFGSVSVVVDPESAELIRERPSSTATVCRKLVSTSSTPTRHGRAVAALRSAELDRPNGNNCRPLHTIVRAGHWLICSGQVGLADGSLVEGLAAQVTQASRTSLRFSRARAAVSKTS